MFQKQAILSFHEKGSFSELGKEKSKERERNSEVLDLEMN